LGEVPIWNSLDAQNRFLAPKISYGRGGRRGGEGAEKGNGLRCESGARFYVGGDGGGPVSIVPSKNSTAYSGKAGTGGFLYLDNYLL